MRNVVLLGCLMLAGCGPAYYTLKDYERSRTAYRNCVLAKGKDNCASEKAILDVDARAYAATSGQVLRVGDAD